MLADYKGHVQQAGMFTSTYIYVHARWRACCFDVVKHTASRLLLVQGSGPRCYKEARKVLSHSRTMSLSL